MSQSGPAATFPFGQRFVWQPNAEWAEASNAAAFMRRHAIASWDDLLARAAAEPAWFWSAALADLDIRFAQPYTQVLDLSDGPEFPRWCVDGRLNIVGSCLDKWQTTPVRDAPAVIWEGEDGRTRTLTYAELCAETRRCADGLRRLGLGRGDVVGIYMPMIPEMVIAFLAVIRNGGIVLPLFSGYGAGSVAARLVDSAARAVVTADGLVRRGKVSPLKDTLDEALAAAPSVERVVVVANAGVELAAWQPMRDVHWQEMMDAGADVQPVESPPADTAADEPLMLIYTSGTTGAPKGAVHTHCGFPVKAAQDLRHCFDLKPGDVLFWLTDMGWMMGPWMVFGALLNGAAMLLYDGAPDFPYVDRLWALVERHRVTHPGISPTLIRSLIAHGVEPVRRHDLSSLRLVGSTGSPWDPEAWMWLFENVLGSRKPILNYSGGTEISGGILCGNLFTPGKPCGFGGPIPGMDVDVVDEAGQPVRGLVGELVIRQPWIGMTRGFWHDRERYLDAYWRRWPGVWAHGDFAAIDDEGQWFILGRSDDTIKVAGKRVGPAEVEAILNAHPAILDSAAVGVPHPIKDQEIVAFCIVRAGYIEGEPLRRELLEQVVHALGKPLTPRSVYFVDALPRTRNAKVMRRVVRAVWLGEPPGDLSSLEDPSAVETIRGAR